MMSDVAKGCKADTAPSGSQNINSPRPLPTKLPLVRLTAMTILHFPTEGRISKYRHATITCALSPSAQLQVFLARSTMLHGSSTVG